MTIFQTVQKNAYSSGQILNNYYLINWKKLPYLDKWTKIQCCNLKLSHMHQNNIWIWLNRAEVQSWVISPQEIVMSTTVVGHRYHLPEINVHNLAALYFEVIPSYVILSNYRNKVIVLNTYTTTGNIQRTGEANFKKKEWNSLVCVLTSKPWFMRESSMISFHSKRCP